MIVNGVVEACKKALPNKRPIENHEPYIPVKSVDYVNDCLKSISDYRYVKSFENKLKEIHNVDCAIATSSGTSALHIALLASGVEPGEEVLVPDMTFVATANAVSYVGAIPHFIDCWLTVAPFKLQQYLAKATKAAADKRGRINVVTGRLIKKLIVVHLLGFPAQINELISVANSFGIDVIEDACEALGSKIHGKLCGSFGIASVLSFNTNKIVTTNGGGALLTNDPWIAAKAWQLATTARVPHKWEVKHDALAWNYRMPNINAALGLGQLEELDYILEKKRAISRNYVQCFTGVGGVKLLDTNAWWDSQPNYWLNTLVLHDGDKREEILTALHDEGIKARAIFTPMHKLMMYVDNPRSNSAMLMAESAERSMICLPSGAGLA